MNTLRDICSICNNDHVISYIFLCNKCNIQKEYDDKAYILQQNYYADLNKIKKEYQNKLNTLRYTYNAYKQIKYISKLVLIFIICLILSLDIFLCKKSYILLIYYMYILPILIMLSKILIILITIIM